MPIHREFLESMLTSRNINVTPMRLTLLERILHYKQPFTSLQVTRDIRQYDKVEHDHASVSHTLNQFNRSGLIVRLEDDIDYPRRRGRREVKYTWMQLHVERMNQRRAAQGSD